MNPLRDEFLSEEDLDLAVLSDEELIAHWNAWLEQAQATNDEDRDLYSHGVLMSLDAGFATLGNGGEGSLRGAIQAHSEAVMRSRA